MSRRVLAGVLLLLASSACSEESDDPRTTADTGVNGADAVVRPDAADAGTPDTLIQDAAGEDAAGEDAAADPDAARPDTAGSPLAELSDDFESGALDPEFTIMGDDVADAVVAGGQLAVTMTRAALWFEAQRAFFIHKEVTGDFKLTGRVHARSAADPNANPNKTIHLGGLMARDPMGTDQGGTENYVFIVVGFDVNDLSVEHKTTRNSSSMYMGPTWPSAEAELRVCRLGSAFRLYKRELGSTTWTLAINFDRPDLPDRLQVGANVYASGAMGPPDLQVFFDELVYAEVAAEGDCSAD